MFDSWPDRVGIGYTVRNFLFGVRILQTYVVRCLFASSLTHPLTHSLTHHSPLLANLAGVGVTLALVVADHALRVPHRLNRTDFAFLEAVSVHLDVGGLNRGGGGGGRDDC